MIYIYDRKTGEKVVEGLANAFDIVEETPLIGAPTLKYSLWNHDEGNQYYKHRDFVQVDNGALYRFRDREAIEQNSKVTTYNCEHVIFTLYDKKHFGTHVVEFKDTRFVLQSILDLQNKDHLLNPTNRPVRWVLGDCDFDRKFHYNWNNARLLEMLFSVPERFDEPYRWVFDTTRKPWVVHLKKLNPDAEPEYFVRDGVNAVSKRHKTDGANVCHRLFLIGQGEGDDNINRIRVEEYNDGLPYVQAGILDDEDEPIENILDDARYTDPESLLSYGKAVVKKLSEPTESMEYDIANIGRFTNSVDEIPRVGAMAQVGEEKKFITKTTIHHDSLLHDSIELSSEIEDASSIIADIQDRARINAQYSNHASDVWQAPLSVNAQPSFPMLYPLIFPAGTLIINRLNIYVKALPYRAYSTVAEQIPSQTTDSYSRPQEIVTSESSGGTVRITGSGGGQQITSGASSRITTPAAYVNPNWGGYAVTDRAVGGDTGPNHLHPLDGFINSLLKSLMLDHYHNMDHTHLVYVEPHDHEFEDPRHSHKFTLPREVHSHIMPGHGHPITNGIKEGTTATRVTLKIDGKQIDMPLGEMIDIAPQLSKAYRDRAKNGNFDMLEFTPDRQSFLIVVVAPEISRTLGGGHL